MSTSLLLTTLFMLFYLSSALVAVVGTGGAWALDNLDDGRLGLLYWMLAVLDMLNFVGVPLLREPARVQARGARRGGHGDHAGRGADEPAGGGRGDGGRGSECDRRLGVKCVWCCRCVICVVYWTAQKFSRAG